MRPMRQPLARVCLYGARLGLARISLLLVLAGCGGEQEREGQVGLDPGLDYDPIVFCEGARYQPLDLQSEDVSPFVGMAAGHHEASLAWRRHVVSSDVRGFEERTRVSLDVTVLAASEFHFEDPEREYCADYRSRALDVEVQLATADGALTGTFRDGLMFTDGALGPGLDNVTNLHPLDAFAGTLVFEVDAPAPGAPPREPERWLQMFLKFGESGASGWLRPIASLPSGPAGPVLPSWVAAEAEFPENRCLGGDLATFDGASATLDAAGRAAYDQLAAHWVNGPVPAVWRSPSGGELSRTELTLSLGPPSHACLRDGSATVYAELSLTAADGSVQFSGELVSELAQDLVRSYVLSPIAPVKDFARVTGVRAFDFGSARYAGVSLDLSIDPASGRFSGTLAVDAQNPFENQTRVALLDWSTGER